MPQLFLFHSQQQKQLKTIFTLLHILATRLPLQLVTSTTTDQHSQKQTTQQH